LNRDDFTDFQTSNLQTYSRIKMHLVTYYLAKYSMELV